MIGNLRDRITVASEKADFIADRIAAGVPASEREIRTLARFLSEIATAAAPGFKKAQSRGRLPNEGAVGSAASPRDPSLR